MTKEEIEIQFFTAFKTFKNLEFSYEYLTKEFYEQHLILFFKCGVLVLFLMDVEVLGLSLCFENASTIAWINANLTSAIMWGFAILIEGVLASFVLRAGVSSTLERIQKIRMDRDDIAPVFKDAKRTYKKLYPTFIKNSTEEV